jgi:hypothetical protein
MSPAGNDETVTVGNSTIVNESKDLLNGDVFSVLFDPAIGNVGESVFAMFIVGIVIVPLYARTEDPTLPAITLALFSGLAIPLLPGQLVNVAWSVLWMAGFVALFGLIQVFR